jgi:hypothetical protein
MMIDEVLAANVSTRYVDSSRADDLEVKVQLAVDDLVNQSRSIRVEGWALGGSGFGPSFLVAIEHALSGTGANAIPIDRIRFFFYSGASALVIAQHRAAAMQRVAAYAAANPSFNALLVDSLLAGGSQGLTQMGMLVVALRSPP